MLTDDFSLSLATIAVAGHSGAFSDVSIAFPGLSELPNLLVPFLSRLVHWSAVTTSSRAANHGAVVGANARRAPRLHLVPYQIHASPLVILGPSVW